MGDYQTIEREKFLAERKVNPKRTRKLPWKTQVSAVRRYSLRRWPKVSDRLMLKYVGKGRVLNVGVFTSKVANHSLRRRNKQIWPLIYLKLKEKHPLQR